MPSEPPTLGICLKKGRKYSPLVSQSSWRLLPACFVLCQLCIIASSRFLGQYPAPEKALAAPKRDWVIAERPAAGTWDESCRTLCKKCSYRPPPRAPTTANTLGLQISPAQHTCQRQAWMCQLSPGLLTRSKSRQWQSRTAHPRPQHGKASQLWYPYQKSPAGQGMSPREQALPTHSSLCRAFPPNTECQQNKRLGREVVWTKLDWSNLSPQAWAKSCCGRQKDTFTLSKAQPENWGILSSKRISLLLIKGLQWLEELTLMKVYHSLYPVPKGVPVKLCRQPQKSGIVLHPIWRRNKSCWQSKTPSRYLGYIQPRTRKRKKKIHPRL